MSNIARFAFRLLIGLPFCAQGLYTLFVWRAREDAILNAWTNWLNYQGIWSNYPNLSEWFFYFVPFMTLAMFALEAFGGALMILRRQSHWAIWILIFSLAPETVRLYSLCEMGANGWYVDPTVLKNIALIGALLLTKSTYEKITEEDQLI